jgi:hypothetical protein
MNEFQAKSKEVKRALKISNEDTAIINDLCSHNFFNPVYHPRMLELGCWPVKIKLGPRWLYKILKPPRRG